MQRLAERATRALAHAVLLAMLGFVCPPSRAEPMEDVDYVLVEPAQAGAPGRIEVIEFFYYGCSACYRLEPLLEAWLKGLPDDVAFRRAPALRRIDWIPLTRLYLVLQQLGAVPRLHSLVYRDIHESGINLGDAVEAASWAAAHGVDRDQFTRALDSDRLAIEVQNARDATIAYGVRTTPTFVVDGRYLTSAGMLGSIDALLPVVDALISKARKARPPH